MSEERVEYGGGSGRRWGADDVARLRAQLGLTQASFARKLGVRQQTVSEWETGRYAPRGASVRVLALLAEEAATYETPGNHMS